MSHIHNEAAYEAARVRKIKANAATGRRRRWIESDPRALEVINFLAGRYNVNPNSFLGKMEDSLFEWGSLTENQRNAVCKIIDQQAERQAEFDAEKLKSNHIGTVGERIQFEATVVFKVQLESGHGYSTQDGAAIVHYPDYFYIVGMKSGDDMIIYKGTGELSNAKKGDTVSFMAKVKEHGERDGQKQTIVQRPTKIEISEA
jgi:hypothetical protein